MRDRERGREYFAVERGPLRAFEQDWIMDLYDAEAWFVGAPFPMLRDQNGTQGSM